MSAETVQGIVAFVVRYCGLTPTPLQRVILKVGAREALTWGERRMYRRFAGKKWTADADLLDFLVVCTGRQCGKSSVIVACLAVYYAYRPGSVEGQLPGEWRHIPVMCQGLKIASVLFDRILGTILASPDLAARVESHTRETIRLKHGVQIQVFAASPNRLRGLKPILTVVDECAWLAEGDSANELGRILDVARGGQLAMKGQKPLILLTSTPGSPVGEFYDLCQRRTTIPGLVAFRATSEEMYPDVDKGLLAREAIRDPENFLREFMAQFRSREGKLFDADDVEHCVERGVRYRDPGGFEYCAAMDPAFRHDAFTVCVGHRDGEVVVIDLLMVWEPGQGHRVAAKYVLPKIKAQLERYGLKWCLCDQYGTGAMEEAARLHGIHLRERKFSSQGKMSIYSALKQAILSHTVKLLDHQQAIAQLKSLEAHASPGGAGNTKIFQPKHSGLRDDLADVLALVVHELAPVRKGGPIKVLSNTRAPRVNYGPGSDGRATERNVDMYKVQW